MRLPVLSLLALAPLLAACETSRFAGGPFGTSDRMAAAPMARPVSPPRIETAPTARVESSPLAPPPSSSGEIVAETPPAIGTPQIGADPIAAQPGAEPPPASPPQQSARVEPPRIAPAAPTAPTQTSLTGGWTARTGGGSCRIVLSSAPKLDLYGASTSGCAARDLQRVNAWELRGDDVFLYEPGGAVAARLKAGNGAMNGALAKTGAPLSLSK